MDKLLRKKSLMLCDDADVYPTIASIRGWKTQRPLETPRIIRYLFDPRPAVVDGEQVINDFGADDNDHPHAE
ncbi:Der1-like family [Phytophthora palmivora]|uniref:Der1-like family n=1 Tax=Phytophthora palmivora TaxID=4796 RepID=A0A2P4YQI2_9STRA|nr:Der1-like family [Phytophthora palmivora]